MSISRILFIGDVHAPWISKKCADFVYKIIEIKKPQVIVQVGDLYDFYSQSRFPRDHSIITPAEEVSEGRKCAQQFWDIICKKSPDSKKFQLMGNHCVRPLKRVQEYAPDLQPFVEAGIRPLFKFDGVETIFDPREELVLKHKTFGNIVVVHGHKSKLGDLMRDYKMNVVHGHSHKGGVHVERIFDIRGRNKILWELDTGYIADPRTKVMGYTPTQHTKSTLGVGYTDIRAPMFIPFTRKILD